MYENNPQISIMLPTYNQPKLLKEAIESILNQTYQNFELIISNNCSPDPEVDRICKEYAQKDSRIRYFCQKENIGCEKNFVFCKKKMRNRLGFAMSDDDIIAPTFIEKCLRKLQETKGAIACSSVIQYIDEDRKPIISNYGSNGDFTKKNPVDNIIAWTKLLHWMGGALRDYEIANLCDTNYKKTFGWDVLYTSQMLLLGKIARVEEPLYTYQIRTKSQDVKQISENNRNFNEYSLISIDLDILLKTFELIFETDKLSILNKLYFYIKMWFTLFRTKHWMEKLNNIATIKCIDLLFENKKFDDIFYILPYIVYIKLKQTLFIIEKLRFFTRKIKPNTVLIVNYDNSDGKTLLEYSKYFTENGQNVDILSSKSYKKQLSKHKNLYIIKTRNFKQFLQFNKIKQYSSIIFTKQTDYIYLLGKNNKATSIKQILNDKEVKE